MKIPIRWWIDRFLTIGSSSPAPPPLEDYLRDEKDVLRDWCAPTSAL